MESHIHIHADTHTFARTLVHVPVWQYLRQDSWRTLAPRQSPSYVIKSSLRCWAITILKLLWKSSNSKFWVLEWKLGVGSSAYGKWSSKTDAILYCACLLWIVFCVLSVKLLLIPVSFCGRNLLLQLLVLDYWMFSLPFSANKLKRRLCVQRKTT